MRLIRLLLLMGMGVCCLGVFPGKPGMPYSGPAVTCRVWRNIPGAQICDALVTDALNRSCDQVRSIDTLEFSPGYKDGWAAAMTAYITPPRTGAYWFSIAARDSGLLYLSTDETPAHLRFIAETPAATDLHTYGWYSAQLGNGVHLVEGQKYLIEVIGKSGLGPGKVDGGMSIGWHMPGGMFQGPIPATCFSRVTAEFPLPTLRVNQFQLSLRPDPAPATQPGIHKFERGARMQIDGQSADLSYLMFLPQHFASDPSTPMLVFLHGNDCQGYNLLGPASNGPIHSMNQNPQLQNAMPMVVMCPQLPPGWRWDTPGAAQAVNGLVDQLCGRYPRIDRKRIYLTGLSMGGRGTWLTVENSPQTYAAVVPISAVDVRPDAAAELLKDLPELHIVCGGDDNGFTDGSHRMYDALKPALGDRVQLTVYPHEGHGVWNHLYAKPEFYAGLTKFSR